MSMRLTVLGGRGAWPSAHAGCSGYLVEQDGFRLLVDPGYATLPSLLSQIDATDVSAVYVTHGHPDHCADLSALLRARVIRPGRQSASLPVYAPAGALDAVLRLDDSETLSGAYELRDVGDRESFRLGPFTATTVLLPHWLPNLALRLEGPYGILAYTGDSGPSPRLPELAGGADVLLADASYPQEVPGQYNQFLSSAVDAAALASAGQVGRLVLTHVMPFVDAEEVEQAARGAFARPVDLAIPGAAWELGSGSHSASGSG